MAAKKRIDFDNDGGRFSQLINLAAEYRRAMDNGETTKAAGHMLRAEMCATHLTDEALVAASETASRREIAETIGMGLAHGTISHRINRARSADSGQPPAHLYLVKRQENREPEFLSLHRTRTGAQDAADAYNTRFGHSTEDSSRAMVIRVSGRFPQEDANAPAIEE